MKNINKGLIVLLAGAGMNLAFGVLYAWSIFGGALIAEFSWTKAQASLPYSVAIISFAVVMIPAGRLQDKIGPRWVATIGGILIGTGCILASYLQSLTGLVFSFGILAGSGIGLGYASTTPAAIKWFSPDKKGLVTGIVVGGFGLASIYIAPLSKFLLHDYGVFTSFRILGILFLVITLPLAQLIVNPHDSHSVPTKKKTSAVDMTWKQMLKTKEFYQLWFMFFVGATAGLMIIGHLKTIAHDQLPPGAELGFLLVALAAIANAIGRPAAGIISDRLGRGKTMAILYVIQACILFVFASFGSFITILAGAMVMYFAYGSMLSVYPSACGDNYGTKNLGLNYGILFSAWGVGGIVGPMIGGMIADKTGSFSLAFTIAAIMLLAAAVMAFLYKPYEQNSKEDSIAV